jgi:SulP family sulfate permease
MSTSGDALIMIATLLGTLFLQIEFAVFLGILLSFAYYIKSTSRPSVFPVIPDQEFKHFVRQQAGQTSCPQLGMLKISGDLYFGAVGHIEDAIRQYLRDHPDQRFLLLRMHSVNHCDLRGVRMLEDMMNILRERGGDLYLMRVEEPVLEFMQSNGFYDRLGYDRFLPEEHAIFYLFRKVLDPSVCVYECPSRVFAECQNLPKQTHPAGGRQGPPVPVGSIPNVSPLELQQVLRNGHAPLVIDVREPNEFKKGHIAQARLVPLQEIFNFPSVIPNDRDIVLVCQGGQRSQRATAFLQEHGYENVVMLQGGMLAWLSAGYPEEIEYLTV